MAACPPVVEYSRELQARAAEELALLPDGSAVIEMMSDYVVTREQVRVCEQKILEKSEKFGCRNGSDSICGPSCARATAPRALTMVLPVSGDAGELQSTTQAAAGNSSSNTRVPEARKDRLAQFFLDYRESFNA